MNPRQLRRVMCLKVLHNDTTARVRIPTERMNTTQMDYRLYDECLKLDCRSV